MRPETYFGFRSPMRGRTVLAFLLGSTFLSAGCSSPAGSVGGTASAQNRVVPEIPLELAEKHAETALWAERGDILSVVVEVPKSGEYALVLDAVVGSRKSRIDTLGARDDDRKANCHLQPGWRTSYLGRMGLSKGSTPLRLKLGWIDDATTGATFESVERLRVVPLEGRAAAGRGCPVDLLCPMLYDAQMKNAPKMIDKIASFDARSVQFVIAVNCELDSEKRPTNFGLVLNDRNPAMRGRVTPMDHAIRSEFQSWLRSAFVRAVERKLKIGVLLHLNCVSKDYVWRNDVRFDPLEESDGASYEWALPLAVVESLEAAAPPDWPIEFTVCGEMGTTTVEHPESWRTIVRRLKGRGQLTNAAFGIGLNHTSNFGRADPRQIDGTALAALWGECDYLGVSMYKDMSIPPTALDFVGHLEYFASELDAMGAPLPPGMELKFVEVGLGGGGMSSKGEISQPAKSLEDLARVPWCGADDPTKNPWDNAQYRDYRRKFHDALLDFLRTQPARWPVTTTCLWTLGSCDPFGVERDDWADSEIVRRVRAHNASLMTSGGRDR